jgi:hypothetical protein
MGAGYGHIPPGSVVFANGPDVPIPQVVAGPGAGVVRTPLIMPWPNRVGVLRPLTWLFAEAPYPTLPPMQGATINHQGPTFTGKTTGIMRTPYTLNSNAGVNG